jgi:alkanesulfonate monooxygenase SsuD/methylene tetrahydromethanopterin reductase-like flavin-dependent oxidoreductase (luciferase family)
VLQRAATAGDGWLTYFYSPESFTKSWTKIRNFATEAGKDADQLLNASQLPIMIGPSKAAVRDEMMDWLNREWDFPEHSDCSRESAIMGSVDECVEQLKAHVAVGVQKIIFVPYKYRMDQVETIARDIIPRMKAS